jgi:hypothetical protein
LATERPVETARSGSLPQVRWRADSIKTAGDVLGASALEEFERLGRDIEKTVQALQMPIKFTRGAFNVVALPIG